MKEAIPRLDTAPELREQLRPYCRLNPGEVWEDPERGHRVGVLDAADRDAVSQICDGYEMALCVHDPPYNLLLGRKQSNALGKITIDSFMESARKWITNSIAVMSENSALYVWMGADQNDGFRPLIDFIPLMNEFDEITSRSFITMRNQRGYGTQKNWMAVRQELLYYTKGEPPFSVVYTDIPKILRGYYKDIHGERTENTERGKADTIRASNVWVDIQQVFYLMEENVPGCYAQKPLKAIERILAASSIEGDSVLDLFSHAGTSLIACERMGRRCFTADIDPVYAEISIRRLEHLRKTGRTGWQTEHPFPELLE